jgi:TolB-like protein/Flp pilus assembly protein TadD
MSERPQRRLAAILAADVVGYSRLMGEDDAGTLAALKVLRKELFSPKVAEHHGRIVKLMGDAALVEFASVVDAVACAVALQKVLASRNAETPADRRIDLRIGVNLGDVIIEGSDIYGDGVNVAARLQELAAPGGIVLSATAYEHAEAKVDVGFQDGGAHQLKNIAKPVRIYHWPNDDSNLQSNVTGSKKPPPLPDKPSIAVLPFKNMSGDPEQEFFADGLTEDIITALSHFRWFFVIARNSSFAYKGRAVDMKQIARELGVRYLLEGSVRKAGVRVRVTGQLIDAETGAHLWAERYDRDLADIFSIQDDLTQQVVGAIEPEILMGEGKRVARRPTANLDAYECHMRGMWFHNQQDTAGNFDEAIRWQRRAIKLDPRFARAHMALVRSLYARIFFGLGADYERDGAEIEAAAARALALDQRDASSHYAAHIAHMFGRHPEAALAEAQRAIDLNPSFALGYLALGRSRVICGHFAEALDPLHTALQLSPHDPMAYHFLNYIALAHYHLGNYEEALHHAGRAHTLRRVLSTLVALLASLGQLGRLQEAQPLLSDLMAPDGTDIAIYLQAIYPYADLAHRAHLYEGLRKAGFAAV